MTMIRSGFASNDSGPTFFMPPGKTRKPEFSDEFLVRHGAAKYSTILMTPTGYLTDETWVVIVPLLAKGLRFVVETKDASLVLYYNFGPGDVPGLHVIDKSKNGLDGNIFAPENSSVKWLAEDVKQYKCNGVIRLGRSQTTSNLRRRR